MADNQESDCRLGYRGDVEGLRAAGQASRHRTDGAGSAGKRARRTQPTGADARQSRTMAGNPMRAAAAAAGSGGSAASDTDNAFPI